MLEFLDAGSIPAVSIYMIYVGGNNLFNLARPSIKFEGRAFWCVKDKLTDEVNVTFIILHMGFQFQKI